METKRKRVVIVGAGFGGIALAKALKKSIFEILLIDQHNFHNFQPLMYQVATGGLEPGSIAYPIRRIFRKAKNFKFRMAKVNFVDTSENLLYTNIGNFKYDYLVIATGSQNNFFNFEPIKEKLLPLKSMSQALDIRSYLMQNIEQALSICNEDAREEVINIAVIGGGPAGVEMAGALAEMKHFVLPKDFPEIDFSKMSVYLFESKSRILASMSEKASTAAYKFLSDLGVKIYVQNRVKNYDGKEIILEDSTSIKTRTVIWTAGVKGNPIEGLSEELIVPGNRIAVDEFNKVHNVKNVFAIGDVASCFNNEQNSSEPMVAPVAIQQGKLLAKNLTLIEQNKPLIPFKFNNQGLLATIGRRKAVADFKMLKFQGTFAWFLWMFVHIMSLIGFRNKLMTFIDWFVNYFNYDRPLGLIIRPFKVKSKED